MFWSGRALAGPVLRGRCGTSGVQVGVARTMSAGYFPGAGPACECSFSVRQKVGDVPHPFIGHPRPTQSLI